MLARATSIIVHPSGVGEQGVVKLLRRINDPLGVDGQSVVKLLRRINALVSNYLSQVLINLL